MANGTTTRGEDIKTPQATIAFAHNLFEPQERDNGKKGYGATLLFKKGAADLSALQKAALAAATTKWGDKAVQWIKDGVVKSPFLDGDGPQAVSKKTGDRHVGFAGTTFIRISSGEDYKPKVFDRRRNPVLDKADVPSGSQVVAVVNPYAWEHPQNGKGISFGVSLVQVVKTAEGDEILGGGGGPDPDKWLEKLDDEGSAPKGDASGLFG